MAHKDDIQTAIRTLQGGDALRVWSFVVTLFGDITRGQGGALSGQTLTALTARVGIKPATMRVALHRLRKDGWIESHKAGRTSVYALTRHGRDETAVFCTRVYKPTKPASELTKVNWNILVSPQGGSTITPQGMYQIPTLTGVFLGHGKAPNTSGYLSISGTLGSVPGWLEDALAPPELRRDFAAFEARLDTLRPRLPDHISLNDRTILRGLIVHKWRRLLLRHPDLPDTVFSQLPGLPTTRRKVSDFLATLGTVSPDDFT